MRGFLFVCALSIVFALAYGAVSISPADPDHPGVCYSELTGEMTYGNVTTLKECIRATCHNDGSIQFAGCGAYAPSPCGKTVADLTKPYPDCCPVPVRC